MYTDLETAFNDNTKELDIIAKNIHNKKTNLYNSVYDDYNKQKLKWDQDIKEYNSGKIHPNNLKLDLTESPDSMDSISIDSISIDSPELDSIMVLVMAWVLAPIDVSLTWIRWYKEAEESRIRQNRRVL